MFAFEPLPPIFAMLERNAQEHFEGRVTVLPYGLFSREDEVEFTYFSSAPLLSSSRRTCTNIESERERIARQIAQRARQGDAGPILERVPTFLIKTRRKGQTTWFKEDAEVPCARPPVVSGD